MSFHITLLVKTYSNVYLQMLTHATNIIQCIRLKQPSTMCLHTTTMVVESNFGLTFNHNYVFSHVPHTTTLGSWRVSSSIGAICGMKTNPHSWIQVDCFHLRLIASSRSLALKFHYGVTQQPTLQPLPTTSYVVCSWTSKSDCGRGYHWHKFSLLVPQKES